MGWMSSPRWTLKLLIKERTENKTSDLPDGDKLRFKCLRHCYRGNRFSGVLWTVWERTKVDSDGNVLLTHRFIGCDLLRCHNEEGEMVWAYKDMDESVFPYTFSCPLSYLKMVPVANEKWRESVREYHAAHAERRKKRRKEKQARKTLLEKMRAQRASSSPRGQMTIV